MDGKRKSVARCLVYTLTQIAIYVVHSFPCFFKILWITPLPPFAAWILVQMATYQLLQHVWSTAGLTTRTTASQNCWTHTQKHGHMISLPHSLQTSHTNLFWTYITPTIFSQAFFPSMKPLGITFGVNSSYLKHNIERDKKEEVENLCIYGDWHKACWHFKIKLSWLTSLLNLVQK